MGRSTEIDSSCHTRRRPCPPAPVSDPLWGAVWAGAGWAGRRGAIIVDGLKPCCSWLHW